MLSSETDTELLLNAVALLFVLDIDDYVVDLVPDHTRSAAWPPHVVSQNDEQQQKPLVEWTRAHKGWPTWCYGLADGRRTANMDGFWRVHHPDHRCRCYICRGVSVVLTLGINKPHQNKPLWGWVNDHTQKHCCAQEQNVTRSSTGSSKKWGVRREMVKGRDMRLYAI
jgi:hypothetical protein